MPSFRGTPGKEPAETGPVATVDTDEIALPDRFGWWSDMVGREVMPVSIRSPHARRFRGWAEAMELPRSRLAAFGFSPLTARRSPAQIRREDPEDGFLVLVREGRVRLEQGRNDVGLGPGDMSLFSSSRPLACDFVDTGAPVHITLLRLPLALLPLSGNRADRLLAEPLPAGTASGALLVPYLTSLPKAARTAGPAELARLGTIAVDLATSLFAARLDDRRALPAESRRTVLLARIDAFIEQHLDDPSLGPAAVAAHHHMSVRTLHHLFRDERESVAATIRRRRLERCRGDLAEPGLLHLTVGEIALRRGFRHPADFSRAFRRAYGVPPSEVRAGHALNAP
ncbi:MULTISPECIES: helix-turn-helix domain-containing protein [unclassified Streptomyces]|uniref:helix-turn-helix domain-containing protein n=1 Tax=unclassified Streptomyces TaxID=2593676 RepID=UPI002E80E419|nr:helix-turn-helix domain-containing protein [Streptomyces sp. NBC_00523]WUD03581.1 helix-turn-helix domain-containing protein [Streptomyces sp. NBC_00523]